MQKKVQCESNVGSPNGEPLEFEIPFDKLVISVGAETNTFGIPGDSSQRRNSAAEVVDVAVNMRENEIVLEGGATYMFRNL